MDELKSKQPPLLPERNPKTHKAHNRQVFYQITMPLVFGIVTALILAILATQAGSTTVSTWADLSLIMMIAPTMIVALLFLILAAGTIYLMVKILPIFPLYARVVQNWFALFASRTRIGADMTVEPILRIQGFVASLHALRRNIRG